MTRRESIGDFIRTQRRLANLSLRQLANITKISNPYLSQVERGLYQPSAQVLKKIAEALDISAQTLYERCGLLEQTTAAPDVEAAIRLDPKLSEEQKDAMIRVYRGFASGG